MAAKEAEQEEMGFMDHLEELRRRLFFALIGILVGGIAIFVSKDWVFNRLIFGPRNPDFITFRAWCALSHFTGAGDRLCVTDITYELINTSMLGNFSAHILVSAIGGFILAFPLTFGQFWRFIRPGLHGGEASAVRGVTWAASGLFFCGVAFGYFVIAPLSLQFLGHYEIGDVQARIAPTENEMSDAIFDAIDATYSGPKTLGTNPNAPGMERSNHPAYKNAGKVTETGEVVRRIRFERELGDI